MAIKRINRQKSIGSHWFYGRHTVLAALANPKRRVHRLLYSREKPAVLREVPCKKVGEAQLAAVLPRSAVHQGLAAEVSPLAGPRLEQVAAASGVILALDQLQDPRNVGAVLRAAAFFRAVAVVAPRRRFPQESGSLAKAASGALEVVPIVRVANLNTALRQVLAAANWQIIGLDTDAGEQLRDYRPSAKTVLVLGGEGDGLRRLVGENCHRLFSLGKGGIDSLNVATAAALALYALKPPSP